MGYLNRRSEIVSSAESDAQCRSGIVADVGANDNNLVTARRSEKGAPPNASREDIG